MPLVRREISAPEKWFQVRREKDIQRPAAAAGRGLDERHVNFIHVRTLFAIHFDADKMFIEKRADLVILKTFPFHDMAPVTGRVTDAQKNRLVFLACPGECRVAPCEPIHGIVRVLEQIGRFFPRETVRMHDGAKGIRHRALRQSKGIMEF